jgi:hypothetical protein
MQTLTLKIEKAKYLPLVQFLQSLDFVEIETKKEQKSIISHKNIQQSAKLYAEIYENDDETKDWTKSALIGWE